MPRAKQFDEKDVLEKAVILFWKKGYHDTSIQDLVNSLGINRASLYDTFGGKKKLFDEAFKWYRTQQLERLRAFLDAPADVREALRLLFQRLIEADCADSDAKGCFIVNTTTELIPSDPALQEVLAQHRQCVEKILLDALSHGVDQGNISQKIDLKTMAQLLYTLMMGLRVVGKIETAPEGLMAATDALLTLLDT